MSPRSSTTSSPILLLIGAGRGVVTGLAGVAVMTLVAPSKRTAPLVAVGSSVPHNNE